MELTKGRNGWRALTEIDLPEVTPWGGREGKPGKSVLQIATHKGYRGGINTNAQVVWKGDTFITHAMGLGTGRGDFACKVLQSAAKCTERAVKAQHEDALAQKVSIIEQARQFYARQAAQVSA